MATTTVKRFVTGVAGTDSTTSPLPLYAMLDAQYADFAFEGIEIPSLSSTISSIKLYFKRESTGNAYLRFRISHTDVDSPPSSQTSDVDTLTAYAGGGTDGKITSLTIPAAAYNSLTIDSGDVLAIKVERDASDALDTYNAAFQIAFVEIVFNLASSLSSDILTLAEVKDYLNKSNTTLDGFITDWIAIVSGQIQEYFDNPYEPSYKVVQETISSEIHDGDGTEFLYPKYYPIDSLSGATDAAKLANLQQRNTPDDAWADVETDIDHVFIDPRKNYIELYDTTFTFGRQNVTITYVAGPDTVALGIKRVACEMLAMIWKESNASGIFQLGEASGSANQGGTSFNKNILDLDKRWKTELDKHKKAFEWHPELTR